MLVCVSFRDHRITIQIKLLEAACCIDIDIADVRIKIIAINDAVTVKVAQDRIGGNGERDRVIEDTRFAKVAGRTLKSKLKSFADMSLDNFNLNRTSLEVCRRTCCVERKPVNREERTIG